MAHADMFSASLSQPELAPLTFVAPSGGQSDAASSVLVESIKRRKMGRPPRSDAEADEQRELSEVTASTAAEEGEGHLVVSEEVVALLDEIEPDPDWLIKLPPEFRAKNWGDVPYVEALVGRGWIILSSHLPLPFDVLGSSSFLYGI